MEVNAMVKTTINLTDELHSKVEKRSQELGVAKSAIIALCVEKYFQDKEVMDAVPRLPQMLDELRKLSEKMAEKESK